MTYKELQFPKDTLFLVTGGAGFIGSNLCEAISGLSTNLSSFIVHDDEAKDRLIITYPFDDITLELPKSEANNCLRWIEDTYFDGMDFNAWYSFEKAMEKDD